MFRAACDNSVTTSQPARPPTANLRISKCPPASPICAKPVPHQPSPLPHHRVPAAHRTSSRHPLPSASPTPAGRPCSSTPGRLPDDDGHQGARNPGRRSDIFERRRLAGRDRRCVSSVHRHPSPRGAKSNRKSDPTGPPLTLTRAIYTVMGFGRLLVTTSRTGRGRTDDAWLVRNRSRQTSGRLCRAALPQ